MGSWRAPLLPLLLLLPALSLPQDVHGPNLGFGQLLAGQWRCMLDDLVSGRSVARVFNPGAAAAAPCYPDVTVHLFSGWPPRRKLLDPRRPGWLRWSGWDPRRRTVLLVHGFNGGVDKAPMTTLRDAFLEQGAGNVLVLDWGPLAGYPCYTDAVRQARTAARCGAQVVAALQASLAGPAAADMRFSTCVGHSLGAHICGMISRTLPFRVAKVVALDPARPQVARILGEDVLSSADARLVQSFHSNAGFYGSHPGVPGAGHAGFCLNGGRLQPSCGHGTRFVRMRCSHFLSVCHYAQVVRGGLAGWAGWAPAGWAHAAACDNACNRVLGQPTFAIKLSEAGMDRWRGTYCLDVDLSRTCRIDL